LGPWTKVFFDVPGYVWHRGQGMTGSLDVPAFLRGLGIAALIGAAATRVGLWWGDWMTRVRR
jgi:hypothetical protein